VSWTDDHNFEEHVAQTETGDGFSHADDPAITGINFSVDDVK
jgi:hypothetical protein